MGTGARTAVIVMTVHAVTAGCGWIGRSSPAPAPTDVAVYDPSGGPGGFAALLAGTLERVDGCVVVRDDSTGGRAADSVPVLPRGVHWDGDALVVMGTTYRLGEHVEFGGGVLAEVGAPAPLAADVPAACAGRLLWLVSAQ
jgi:hypothetical protein